MKTFLLILLSAFCFQFSTFSQQPALVNPPGVAKSGSGPTNVVNGLVIYWKFSEGTGTTANDSSGNGNNGTLGGTSTPTWQSPPPFENLAFANGQVLSGNITLTNNFTVSAWVNVTTGSYYTRIDETGYNKQFYLGENATGEKFEWMVNDATLASPADSGTFSIGQWYMVTGTFDGTTGLIYVNGVQAASQTFTAPGAVTLPNYCGIASAQGGGGFPFSGKIYGVRIYSRTLSASEILDLYNYGQP